MSNSLMERDHFSLSFLIVFLAHCSIFFSVLAAVTDVSVDQQVLLTLKDHVTQDPTNPLLSNWSTGTFFCDSWIGVTCHVQSHRVTALNLSKFHLRGTIPPQLGNLTSLQTLDLSYNQLSGAIPSSIFAITSLQTLDLSNNQLSGSFPSITLNMTSLQTLRFNWNRLSGELSEDIFNNLPNMKILNLTGNMFEGRIPSSLFKCKELLFLCCRTNQFTGEIPRQIGNLTKLKEVSLGFNKLQGAIPGEIGNLHNLQILSLPDNNLFGKIPDEIFNMSSLTLISLSQNHLTGTLPWNIGLRLPRLEQINLGNNRFSGHIPASISNASMLTKVGLPHNFFFGSVPNTLCDLIYLKSLNLGGNNLTIQSYASGSSFLTSLTNLTGLMKLYLSENPLNVVLPTSFGRFSTSIQVLHLEGCNIKGSISSKIGNLSNLLSLHLSDNELSGSIPDTIGKLQKLQALYVQNNRLQGSIPITFCVMERLYELLLDNNTLNGSLPECLHNLISLRYLSLSSNRLSSTIPSTMWSLIDILEINLASNSINGSLPTEIGNLKAVVRVDLSGNQLSGYIPVELGRLEALQELSLAGNNLQGTIPDSLGDLVSLKYLDLSSNNLFGAIPKKMEEISSLRDLNVSFNSLEGEIPKGGPFENFSAKSFVGNKALCGDPRLQLRPCKTRSHKHLLIYLLPAVAALVLLLLAIMLVLIRCRKRKQKLPDDAELSPQESLRRLSYAELCRATDGFSENRLIGKGSFGSVYRGTLQDGMQVAVKVFHLHIEGGLKSFDTECEVMRNTRHRNLVKIISSCSNNHFKALVMEYMLNGSLEDLLYGNNCSLDIRQRLNLAIDIASGLEYLHYDYFTPIVHCDLKPSNILLDQDMVARLSDFGIAKLLAHGDSITQTQTLATIGYMAPEYGREGKVSRKGDIYSYGIMLMEIFTKKKPTSEYFVGEMSLKRWVSNSLHNSITEVVDSDLLSEEDEHLIAKEQCLSSILSFAIECTSESPEKRINIREVVNRLSKIRDTLVANLEQREGVIV